MCVCIFTRKTMMNCEENIYTPMQCTLNGLSETMLAYIYLCVEKDR